MPDNITTNDNNTPITENSKIYNSDGTIKDTELGYADIVWHKPTEAPAKAPEVEKIQKEVEPIINEIPETDNQAKVENGEQTTSFITKAVKGTEATATGTMNVAGQLVNTGGVILNAGAQSLGIATSLTNKVITNFTEIITQKTAELAFTAVTYGMKWPVDVNKHSLSYFNKYIGEITKEAMIQGGLSPAAFDQLKEMKKQAEEEYRKKLEQLQGTQLQLKGVEKIKDTLKDVKEGIASITDHIAEGPSWVSEKTNEFIEKHTDNINTTLNKYKGSIADWEEKSSKKVGESLGKELLEEQKEIIKAKTKKQAEKIQKLQTKATTEANNQIKLAVIKLAALIGI